MSSFEPLISRNNFPVIRVWSWHIQMSYVFAVIMMLSCIPLFVTKLLVFSLHFFFVRDSVLLWFCSLFIWNTAGMALCVFWKEWDYYVIFFFLSKYQVTLVTLIAWYSCLSLTFETTFWPWKLLLDHWGNFEMHLGFVFLHICNKCMHFCMT